MIFIVVRIIVFEIVVFVVMCRNVFFVFRLFLCEDMNKSVEFVFILILISVISIIVRLGMVIGLESCCIVFYVIVLIFIRMVMVLNSVVRIVVCFRFQVCCVVIVCLVSIVVFQVISRLFMLVRLCLVFVSRVSDLVI